jgi:hypothetical protein
MIFKYLALSSTEFEPSIAASSLDLSDNRRSEGIFKKLQGIIHNDEKSLKLFKDSQNLIKQAIDAKKDTYKQLNRAQGFTGYILFDLLGREQGVRARRSNPDDNSGIKIGKEYTSTIARLNEGFGFITYRTSEINNLFFHWTYQGYFILKRDLSNLKPCPALR